MIILHGIIAVFGMAVAATVMKARRRDRALVEKLERSVQREHKRRKG